MPHHLYWEINMKIKITSERNPWANGSPCAQGQEIELDDETGKAMVEAGMALEIGASKPKRARNAKGQVQSDDPLTPDVNEAWEGGKAPVKKTKKKAKK
tara:strand:- start:1240 stop:1536 length:297 start_codon:yes stop_codon:yes gene_type:complete